MRQTTPFLLLTACALITGAAGCRAKDSGTETAGRRDADSADASAERGEEVPITTASDEARTLYVRGRALSDQLRTHDARKVLGQAAAKDPTFALVHYDLAFNSPTPKEFLAHLEEAVTLSSKASEGERLMILALQPPTRPRASHRPRAPARPGARRAARPAATRFRAARAAPPRRDARWRPCAPRR